MRRVGMANGGVGEPSVDVGPEVRWAGATYPVLVPATTFGEKNRPRVVPEWDQATWNFTSDKGDRGGAEMAYWAIRRRFLIFAFR